MLALVFLPLPCQQLPTIVGCLQSELLLLNDLVHTNFDYAFLSKTRNVGHNDDRWIHG